MGKKRGPYSSPRQRERRSRVLRTAANHLEQHGLSALTMQTIADISEVSTKTLYNLFGSRDLLLMEAASARLADLEENPRIQAAEPGIPRLLVYTAGTMKQFEEMPQYACAVVSILVQADMEPEAAYARLGVVKRFAQYSLHIAAAQGELREDVDIENLAYHISANQWGAVLLWERGILRLEQLVDHITLSHYLTLTPACIGARREVMEQELAELLAKPAICNGWQQSTEIHRREESNEGIGVTAISL